MMLLLLQVYTRNSSLRFELMQRIGHDKSKASNLSLANAFQANKIITKARRNLVSEENHVKEVKDNESTTDQEEVEDPTKNETAEQENEIEIDNSTQEGEQAAKEKVPEKADNLTLNLGENPKLHEVIDSVTKSTKSHPIVIINHNTDPLQEEHDKPEKFDQFGAEIYDSEAHKDAHHITPVNAPVLHYEQKSVSISDISNLSNVVTRLQKKYQEIYATFPFEATEHKSSLKETANIVEYHKNIGNFVKLVLSSRGQIQHDVNSLKTKVTLLKTDEQSIMHFYNLERTYDGITDKLKNISGNVKIAGIEGEISNIEKKFVFDTQSVLAHCDDLFKLESFFENEISQLENTQSDQETISSLETFDKTINLAIKIVELKKDIETALEEIKAALERLRENGDALADKILDLRKEVITEESKENKELANNSELRAKGLLSSGTSIYSTVLVLLLSSLILL